jgi:hypothetical protein
MLYLVIIASGGFDPDIAGGRVHQASDQKRPIRDGE